MIETIKNKVLAPFINLYNMVTNPVQTLKNGWQRLIELRGEILKAGILGIAIFAASYFFVWWAGAIVSFLYAAFKKDMTAKEAFAVGASAGAIAWATYAGIINSANEGLLATKISVLLSKGTLSSAHILQITGAIGGLLCGLGAASGHYLREFLYDTRLKFGWKW
jgi:hypothetical protein